MAKSVGSKIEENLERQARNWLQKELRKKEPPISTGDVRLAEALELWLQWRDPTARHQVAGPEKTRAK